MPLRQFIRAALALGCATLAAGTAIEAGAATAIGTATAVVVSPLSIENTKPLVFGAFQAHAGAVTVTPSGERAGEPAALLGTGASAGEITIHGAPDASYTVTGSGSTMVAAAGGAQMAITDLRFADAGAPGQELTTGVLTGGTQVLKVGATLAVDARQPPGAYSGSYTVTVNYN